LIQMRFPPLNRFVHKILAKTMKPISPIKLIPTFVLVTSLGFGFTHLTFGQTDSKSHASPNKQQTDKQKTAPTKFLQVVNDAAGKPKAMQTAITRYRPAKGDLVVDLIGAVHIGEADYYRQLNTQFENYDVVLYELVAPQGTRIPAGGNKKSSVPTSPMGMVGWMQGQAQSTLGLESQLEKIDYQKKNFKHADLSPAQIGEKMAERGDTPLTIGLSAISEMMRQQNKASKAAADGKSPNASQLGAESLFEMIGDPLKMKLMMANQFAASGVMDSGLGASLNQLLITDRNAAAMQVMQKQIVQGKKKIAIFYGAAHMADFEKRLVKDFGMSKTKQVWVNAWDLTKAGQKPKTSGTTKLLFQLLDELGK